MTLEEESLRRIVVDLHWMARRYCDGRMSAAPTIFNQHTRTLLKLGVPLNPLGQETIWARDGMGRAYDGLTDEEASQGEQLRPIDIYRDEEVEKLRKEVEALQQQVRRFLDDFGIPNWYAEGLLKHL